MTTKKIRQRILPLTDKYTFISAKYIPVIDGDGTCCENCGKIISHIVTVKNDNGKLFDIGADCAKTLTGLQTDPEWLFSGRYRFEEGKQVRAKIKKHMSNGSIKYAYIWTNNETGAHSLVLCNERGASTMRLILYPEITIPFIKDLLTEKPIFTNVR